MEGEQSGSPIAWHQHPYFHPNGLESKRTIFGTEKTCRHGSWNGGRRSENDIGIAHGAETNGIWIASQKEISSTSIGEKLDVEENVKRNIFCGVDGPGENETNVSDRSRSVETSGPTPHQKMPKNDSSVLRVLSGGFHVVSQCPQVSVR